MKAFAKRDHEFALGTPLVILDALYQKCTIGFTTNSGSSVRVLRPGRLSVTIVFSLGWCRLILLLHSAPIL